MQRALRDKLAYKTTEKVVAMSTTLPSAKKAPDAKKKSRLNAPIVISGSDSDEESEAGIRRG